MYNFEPFSSLRKKFNAAGQLLGLFDKDGARAMPTILLRSSSEIASPSSDDLANTVDTFMLSTAPYTRYRSDGSALVTVGSDITSTTLGSMLTALGYSATYDAADIERLAGVSNAVALASATTYPRALIAWQSSGQVTLTCSATTFISLTYADNGGKVQVGHASNVHGITSASVGRYVMVTWSGGTGVNGLQKILTVDDTTHITLDLTYAAGLGTPTVYNTGNPIVIASGTIEGGLIGANGQLQPEFSCSQTNSAGSKSYNLYIGSTVTNNVRSGGTSISDGTATTSDWNLVRSRIYNNGSQSAQRGSRLIGSSTMKTSTIDTSVTFTWALEVQIPAADAFISLESGTITVVPRA